MMSALGVISHCWDFILLPSCKPNPLSLIVLFDLILTPTSLQGSGCGMSVSNDIQYFHPVSSGN